MTLSAYETNTWLQAAFFVILGCVFLYLSRKNDAQRQSKIIPVRLLFVLLAFSYFAFAHLAVYGALIYNVEYGECEPVINTTTTTGATTAYTYLNDCQTLPAGQETYLQGYTWLLYLEAAIVGIGVFLFFIERVLVRW